MDLEAFFNKDLSELNIIFHPLTLERIQMGRLIGFELIKQNGELHFYTSENIQEELGFSMEDFYINLKVKDILDFKSTVNIIQDFTKHTNQLDSELINEFKFTDGSKMDRWGYLYANIFYKDGEWEKLSGYILDISIWKNAEKFQEFRDINQVNQYIELRIKEGVAKELNKEKIEDSKKRHIAVAETIEKVAHQWRQPLNVISLLAQDLYFKINLGSLFPPESTKEDIKDIITDSYNDTYEKINSHIQYLSETVDDFRKHLTDSSQADIQYFNLKRFFEDIEDFAGPSIERELITLSNMIDLDFIELLGIENNLKQIVLNILHNAQDIFRDRNIKNRKINLYAYMSDNHIYIEISDNAGGIKSDILPKIFDPYFTTRHETQGTGLGLYMSKELIHKGFNGDIYAINKNLCDDDGDSKAGACFTIKIPNFREI